MHHYVNNTPHLREYARYAADEQKKQQSEYPTREQEQRDIFFLKEQKYRLLPTLYQKMLTEGSLFDDLGMKDHIGAIRNVLRNTAVIYHRMYLSILKKEEKIRWWNDVGAVNRSGMMRYIFPSYVNDIGIWSVLREVKLTGAYLTGAVLTGVDLNRADLSEAHLFWAHLTEVDLTEAHLDGADLAWAHLNGAHLNGAHLNGADLRKADLREADLSGADLRGATLPSDFRSYDQDEQIAHLKSLRIPGLKI